VFFTPFVPFFDQRVGRPSIPMETYHLRMVVVKFRYLVQRSQRLDHLAAVSAGSR
jgi:hypothetical protein